MSVDAFYGNAKLHVIGIKQPTVQKFETTFFAKDHWRRLSTRNAQMVNIVNWIQFIHLRRSLLKKLNWAEGSSDVLSKRIVRPLSGVNFHIFDFFSETAERNSMTLDR